MAGQDSKKMPKSSLAAVEDAEILAELLPVPAQIEHFLSGATDGRALFAALYDHILDEPIPERLSALLRR